jgi:hypothetical protein
VLEQGNTYTDHFATEPYETGWASEARWFVHVLELSAGTELHLQPDISPDGLTWCAEGSAPLQLVTTGLYSLKLRDFGHWLRLSASLRGAAPHVKLVISLALKE